MSGNSVSAWSAFQVLALGRRTERSDDSLYGWYGVGTQADVQLTLTFLETVHELWREHPGSYRVRPDPNDLVSALAQTCIKALAAQLRHSTDKEFQEQTKIEGELTTGR